MNYENIVPKVGDYVMHYMCCKGDGTLVQIEDEKEGRLGVRYVPCGGFSYRWPPEEFGLVVNPLLIAICKQDDARIKKLYHERQAKKRENEETKWAGVVECLKDAEKNIKLPVKS